VALGSEPFLATRHGIVRLKTHPLTAAGTRFREYVLEAERALVEREKQLRERCLPRSAATAAPHVSERGPGRTRRQQAIRA
jgi:hypothetical protein